MPAFSKSSLGPTSSGKKVAHHYHSGALISYVMTSIYFTKNGYLTMGPKKISEFLLVLPFCTCSMVRQRRIIHLP